MKGNSGREAFERLAFKHLDGLYNFALHQTGNRAEAENLVVGSFKRAKVSFARFEPGTDFKTWIYTILRNTAIVRSSRSKTRDHNEIDGSIKSDSGEGINAAAATLPEDHRVPLVLSIIEGFTYAEIARITASSIKTVRARIDRALRRLQGALITEGSRARSCPSNGGVQTVGKTQSRGISAAASSSRSRVSTFLSSCSVMASAPP